MIEETESQCSFFLADDAEENEAEEEEHEVEDEERASAAAAVKHHDIAAPFFFSCFLFLAVRPLPLTEAVVDPFQQREKDERQYKQQHQMDTGNG